MLFAGVNDCYYLYLLKLLPVLEIIWQKLLFSSYNNITTSDVHKDPDYDRRVQDYTAAFQGMDNDGDGTITFEVLPITLIEM